MTLFQGAALGAELAAAVTAVLLARRRLEHVPAAIALCLLCAANVARAPVAAALLPPRPEPWEGTARLLVYLDGALLLAAVAVMPGLALAVCVSPVRRRVATAIVAAAWALASVVLAALYPSPMVRGASLQALYLAADLIGLFVSIAALAWWARLRRSPGSGQLAAIALVLLDVGILFVPFGPWRAGLIAGRYDVVQVGIVVFFAGFAAAQGVAWRFATH